MTALDRLAALVYAVAGTLLAIAAFGMLATIAGRYVGFATAWADEVARIAFVWSASLGAASGLYRGAHFAVGLVGDASSPRTRAALALTVDAIVVGLCMLVLAATVQSIPVAASARLPALGISGAWFHAAISAFATLAMVFMAGRLALHWRDWRAAALHRAA